MQLPVEFLLFAKRFFASEYNSFLQALALSPPVSVRINRQKNTVPPTSNPTPWCSAGYYLEQRPAFIFDPLFHAGCYYVQEASSMFLEQAIQQYVHHPVRVLDACAAPGGKSTHLLSLLPEGSLLVANEVIRSRAGILAENIAKWGCANVTVTANDPADFCRLPDFFDVVLVDAPCSGEGMFRKDAATVAQWSPKNVQLCAERQQRILAACWKCLKPGGMLIYSTCTYNTAENEENIDWLLRTFHAVLLPLNFPAEWGVSSPVYPAVYRFFPHKVQGEGFSLAVVQKPIDDTDIFLADKPRKYKFQPLPVNWIRNKDEFITEQNGNCITVFPVATYAECQQIRKHLRVVTSGIPIAVINRKDISPTPQLALSVHLNKSAFVCFEADLHTAIAYLRREAIALPANMERGYILITYNETALGFVKNTGTRGNNLYPLEWRIKKMNN
ncbi:MAG: rRNA cytosine-C5-methyltransferase [Bacteroidales bacterium]|jgi:16S rRNA C967 or C1407 C5-methylase (RsmB/RsmF family)/NOL1/NOP2/fmu family ribosome biogenesis protein|nr:rRNA cytosine-C5-methyltransferase [Bacteroidales bacterium]